MGGGAIECYKSATLSRRDHSHRRAFRKCRWRGRRSAFARGTRVARSGRLRNTFARSGADVVAGAALSQGSVQISCQAQQFRFIRRRLRAQRFGRASADLVAGDALCPARTSEKVFLYNFK